MSCWSRHRLRGRLRAFGFGGKAGDIRQRLGLGALRLLADRLGSDLGLRTHVRLRTDFGLTNPRPLSHNRRRLSRRSNRRFRNCGRFRRGIDNLEHWRRRRHFNRVLRLLLGQVLGGGALPGRLHSAQLFPCLLIASIYCDQATQPALGVTISLQPLVDIRKRLERDDVLVVQAQHVRKGRFRRGKVTEILMAPAEHDARWDVIGVELQPGGQQLQGPGYVSIFSMHFRKRRESESMRVLSVPAL
jgi:hypothetical protein